MRTGQARDCRQSLNGSTLHWTGRSKEILSRAKDFTQAHCQLPGTTDVFTNCLAMFGNGLAVPPRPTPAIGRRRARSANTTANSCAISTFCEAVPAPRRAPIFAALIVISSNQKNAGSLPGSDSHAIHNESVRRDRQAHAERYCHNERRPADGY